MTKRTRTTCDAVGVALSATTPYAGLAQNDSTATYRKSLASRAFFTPNGTLLEPGIFPIHTHSIRVFMASFPGVRVDSATAVPDTIEVLGNTALLWGSYFERRAFSRPANERAVWPLRHSMAPPAGRCVVDSSILPGAPSGGTGRQATIAAR